MAAPPAFGNEAEMAAIGAFCEKKRKKKREDAK
jgi:hypothetical protein